MDNVRVGVIGFGNMGSAHAKHIFDGLIKGLTLTAICDTDESRREKAQNAFPGVNIFESHTELLASGTTDAIIIATPHYFHCPIAIDAFNAGQHVLTEKPAGVYTKQIKEMNTAAEKSGKVFVVMFNQRTNMLFKKAHDLVKNGELGELKRMVWIITNWYRTQHYYDSGSWRATWSGEGGGVLLNQAPHNLDLWQWICGKPKRVRGFCSVAKYHNIEVEDDATIYAEYPNGATAIFITSTGEAPGTNRLEIAGTKGKLVIESGKLTLCKLKIDEREFCFECQENSSAIPSETVVIEQTERETAHKGILQNFANAILHGEELLSPGFDGINEVEISNAAYLSSWQDRWVELPVDEDLYYAELKKRADNSSLKTTNNDKHADMKYSERWSVRW